MFLLKLYQLKDAEYSAFYEFHSAYFLHNHPGQEETFLTNVREIVFNRIKHFKRLDPFGGKYASGLKHTLMLEMFLNYLRSIDRWHNQLPIESVLSEKDKLIGQLREKITQ